MSVTSGFFNSLSGDRKYDAIQISSMFDGLITDGIYNGFLESFMVTASSPASMVVTVGEGRCWFNHTWTLNDAPLPLTLDVGDVVLNRIDTIVIDVDSTDTVRACTIKVIKGTPSSQAVRPTLENTETHHQYPLCDISVPAGATTITQSNITNRRGTSDCPFVATLMESVDVDELLVQWESQWNDWMTDRADAMDTWTAEQKEAFTTWFQTVQDILDENTAGNLLNRINHRTGINATATYSAGVVAITAPDDAGEILTFVAPSDFLSSDTYTLNGEALTITDLNGEALDDSWKKDSPITITVSGGKAFFKAGGSGKNDTLPPLLGNMTVEVVEGDENDTYTIKMDKLILDKTTEMVGGAQLEWGEEMPAKPGKGTGGIKTWTREEVITTGKPYDGLYLGDATPSDAVTETLLWLPENKDGKVVLIPFIILSVDYLGGVYVVRKFVWDASAFGVESADSYDGSTLDTFMQSYANSVISDEILNEIVEVDYSIFSVSLSGNKTVKRKVITVSAGECNMEGFTDGNKIPRFSTPANRIAYDESGQARDYWTRTKQNASSSIGVNTSGNFIGYTPTSSQYTRPSFVLPKDFKIQQRPDGSYTVWNEQGLMTLGDIDEASDINILHVEKSTQKNVDRIYKFAKKGYREDDTGLLVTDDLNYIAADQYKDGTYPNSKVYSYLRQFATATSAATAPNVDFYLHSSVQKILHPVTIPYTKYDGTVQSSKESCFLLSAGELGYDFANQQVSKTGPIIPYYKTESNRRWKNGVGTYADAWTRDHTGGVSYMTFYANSNGTVDRTASGSNMLCPPAITILLTTPIRALADGTYDLVPEDPALARSISTMAEAGTPDNGDGTYTFAGDEPASSEFVSHTVEVPHGQKVVFRQFTQNQKKQFQTMLVGGVYPPLGEVEPPFALPEFTGNHAIFGDETAGRIELYESGELTLSPGTYDFFLVGGGAGGNPIATNYYRNPAGGGGGSGYTATQKAISLDSVTVILAFIGAGGASKTAGTDTSLSYTGTSPWTYTAEGAPAPAPGISGGNGGSGGGVGAGGGADDGGAGGSDGADGGHSGSESKYAGTGQGTTTRAFGESANTLYAGAGGGGVSGAYGTPGPGGAGGGGTGGVEARNGQSATPNTGGGGGGGGGTWSEDDTDGGTGGTGGSGIIIIRWNNT